MGFFISEDVANRKADFILVKSQKVLNIEVDYFFRGGSKPEEIIDSYINRQNDLKKLNIGFALLTDGYCWDNKDKNQLQKGFRNLDYLLNYHLAKYGMLEEIIKEYGADSSRVFTLFAAPPEKELEWNMNGLAGAYRFINRLYLLVSETNDFDDKEKTKLNNYEINLAARNEKDENIHKKLHQTVKKVTESIEDDFHFNTAIAAIMELLNDMTTYKHEIIDKKAGSSESKKIWKEVLDKTILMISPFAPHVSDELWEMTGNNEFIFEEEWPNYNEELIKENKINLVIQINGKIRDTISVEVGISNEESEKLAFNSERIKKFIDGKEVLKVIVIPNKLVNVVVK